MSNEQRAKSSASVILHDNINESYLHRDDLRRSVKGTIPLADNFISRIRRL